ncbi:MAG: dihydroorotate dehydrogenase electron transfer subunit [Lachnospiraceae bacterium]|nr:dihydroorotate dehydrogenase electron transfer subunit [Lachnospiraceae bacterium]
MEKSILRASVLSQEQIADQIYSMWLQADAIAKSAVPGQFVSVYSNDSGRMLPRPISICEADRDNGRIRLVYRVAGKGTAEFAGCQAMDTLDLLGPLGNGFPLERCPAGRSAFLIGGGIGIPPMVELSKRLEGRVQVIAGYRDELFLTDELAANGELYLSVEKDDLFKNLSVGADAETDRFLIEGTVPEQQEDAGIRSVWHGVTHGNVLDCIRENQLQADVIYACGPTPMLRAIKAYAQEKGIECYLSLEQRMACGIGACLACVCESAEVDAHSQVKNKRICKEGPVFAADEVIL